MFRLGLIWMAAGVGLAGCGPLVGEDGSGDTSTGGSATTPGTTTVATTGGTIGAECEDHADCGVCAYCEQGVCRDEPCCSAASEGDRFRCSEVGDECWVDEDCPDDWTCDIGVCVPPEEPPTLPLCEAMSDLYSVEQSLPATAADLRLWDIDGDDDDEAIVAYQDGTVEVREPIDGTVISQSVAFGPTVAVHAVAPPDDGLAPDLLLVLENGELLSLEAGPGTTYPVAESMLELEPTGAVTTGDFDGDGLHDAASSITVADPVFTAAWGSVDGLEPGLQQWSLNAPTITLAPFDGNGDGLADLVALRDVDGNASVQPWWGGEDRSFTVAGSRSAPFEPVDVATGELAIEPGSEVIAIGAHETGTHLAVFGRDGNSLLEPELFRVDGSPVRIETGSLSGTGGDDGLLLTTEPHLLAIVFDEQGQNACAISLLLPKRGLSVRVGNLDLESPGLEAYVVGVEGSAALVMHQAP